MVVGASDRLALLVLIAVGIAVDHEVGVGIHDDHGERPLDRLVRDARLGRSGLLNDLEGISTCQAERELVEGLGQLRVIRQLRMFLVIRRGRGELDHGRETRVGDVHAAAGDRYIVRIELAYQREQEGESLRLYDRAGLGGQVLRHARLQVGRGDFVLVGVLDRHDVGALRVLRDRHRADRIAGRLCDAGSNRVDDQLVAAIIRIGHLDRDGAGIVGVRNTGLTGVRLRDGEDILTSLGELDLIVVRVGRNVVVGEERNGVALRLAGGDRQVGFRRIRHLHTQLGIAVHVGAAGPLDVEGEVLVDRRGLAFQHLLGQRDVRHRQDLIGVGELHLDDRVVRRGRRIERQRANGFSGRLRRRNSGGDAGDGQLVAVVTFRIFHGHEDGARVVGVAVASFAAARLGDGEGISAGLGELDLVRVGIAFAKEVDHRALSCTGRHGYDRRCGARHGDAEQVAISILVGAVSPRDVERELHIRRDGLTGHQLLGLRTVRHRLDIVGVGEHRGDDLDVAVVGLVREDKVAGRARRDTSRHIGDCQLRASIRDGDDDGARVIGVADAGIASALLGDRKGVHTSRGEFDRAERARLAFGRVFSNLHRDRSVGRHGRTEERAVASLVGAVGPRDLEGKALRLRDRLARHQLLGLRLVRRPRYSVRVGELYRDGRIRRGGRIERQPADRVIGRRDSGLHAGDGQRVLIVVRIVRYGDRDGARVVGVANARLAAVRLGDSEGVGAGLGELDLVRVAVLCAEEFDHFGRGLASLDSHYRLVIDSRHGDAEEVALRILVGAVGPLDGERELHVLRDLFARHDLLGLRTVRCRLDLVGVGELHLDDRVVRRGRRIERQRANGFSGRLRRRNSGGDAGDGQLVAVVTFRIFHGHEDGARVVGVAVASFAAARLGDGEGISAGLGELDLVRVGIAFAKEVDHRALSCTGRHGYDRRCGARHGDAEQVAISILVGAVGPRDVERELHIRRDGLAGHQLLGLRTVRHRLDRVGVDEHAVGHCSAAVARGAVLLVGAGRDELAVGLGHLHGVGPDIGAVCDAGHLVLIIRYDLTDLVHISAGEDVVDVTEVDSAIGLTDSKGEFHIILFVGVFATKGDEIVLIRGVCLQLPGAILDSGGLGGDLEGEGDILHHGLTRQGLGGRCIVVRRGHGVPIGVLLVQILVPFGRIIGTVRIAVGDAVDVQASRLLHHRFIGNRVKDGIAGIRISLIDRVLPLDHDRSSLNQGVILPAGRQRICCELRDGEGVGARTVDLDRIKLPGLAADAIVRLHRDRDRIDDRGGLGCGGQGGNVLHDVSGIGDQIRVERSSGFRCDTGQPQLEVEGVFRGGECLDELRHLQRDLDHALVGDLDDIVSRLKSLLRGRDKQREHVPAVRLDQRAGTVGFQDGRIAVYIHGDRARGRGYDLDGSVFQHEALARRHFLNIIFLPPVQADNGDLAILAGNEVGLAVFVNVILAILIERELEQLARQEIVRHAGEVAFLVDTLGILVPAVDMEHCALDLEGRIILSDLLKDHLAGHADAKVLGLVDIHRVTQVERPGRVLVAVAGRLSAAGGLGEGPEVAVESVGLDYIVGRKQIRIVGHIVADAVIRHREDLQQGSRHIRIELGHQVVVVRVGRLQSRGIQMLIRRSAALIQAPRAALEVPGAKVGKAPVQDGFTYARVYAAFTVIDLATGVFAVVDGCHRQVVLKLGDDFILAVVTAVAIVLLRVIPVFIDPQVAFHGDALIVQRDGHAVGIRRSHGTAVPVETEVIHRVRESYQSEVRILRDIFDVGLIGNEHGGVLRKSDMRREQDQESSDGSHLVLRDFGSLFPAGGQGIPVRPCRGAIRVVSTVQPIDGVAHRAVHRSSSTSDRAGIVVEVVTIFGRCRRVVIRDPRDGRPVVRNQDNVLHDNIPVAMTSGQVAGMVTDLGQAVANAHPFLAGILTIVDGQLVFHPALSLIARRGIGARSGAEEFLLRMVAIVLVAPDSLDRNNRLLRHERAENLVLNPDVIVRREVAEITGRSGRLMETDGFACLRGRA